MKSFLPRLQCVTLLNFSAFSRFGFQTCLATSGGIRFHTLHIIFVFNGYKKFFKSEFKNAVCMLDFVQTVFRFLPPFGHSKH